MKMWTAVFSSDLTSCLVWCHIPLRCFLLPEDQQIELEYWAESGDFTPTELHHVRVQDNRLFSISPRSGSLQPGQQRAVQFTYRSDMQTAGSGPRSNVHIHYYIHSASYKVLCICLKWNALVCKCMFSLGLSWLTKWGSMVSCDFEILSSKVFTFSRPSMQTVKHLLTSVKKCDIIF